jgi:hydrogenase nickel insertion protein HypA
MHEFSIAQQIVEVVLRTARENQAKLVERVLVVIGELALLSDEQVRFWVEEIFSHKALTRGAKLEIHTKPASVHCEGCGYQGAPPRPGPEAHFLLPTLVCPRCGQPGMAIKEGRECLIQRITFRK